MTSREPSQGLAGRGLARGAWMVRPWPRRRGPPLRAPARAADLRPGLAGAPLAPRPIRREKLCSSGFPEQTGCITENPYADPRMRGELYEEFETSSIGTGVAIGDYDGDGRPESSSSARPRAAGSSGTSAATPSRMYREGRGRRAAGGLDRGGDLRRHQQHRPPRHLRLPDRRAQPPLHQPGGRDVQGDGPPVRARCRRFERDGGLLRLRPGRLARSLPGDQHPERHPAPERPARLPLSQQPQRDLHRRDRRAPGSPANPRATRRPGGTSTTTAGPTSTWRTTTGSRTGSTATTATAPSPTSSTASPPTPRSHRWGPTSAT